ncbi:hypothetical protein Q4493_10720 [Colwellia sp. 1_MG-2023]|uniref:hypothetical protein n=1 Tax=Colwellia sp. 1_MG-2023 TaxID=3062649 RepID=UPI0026E11BB7|nr:hypothetical protein [Colwellia sp. 1_MG-2023]MDO6446244.1 hypothetical protein [Colwellia sp. 1_MG-2023]
MTSIYKPLIKFIFISITLITGFAFSAFSTVKQSQSHYQSQSHEVNNRINKQMSNATTQVNFKPKSKYGKKLQRDINRLMPGNKQFTPRFLQYVLTDKK